MKRFLLSLLLLLPAADSSFLRDTNSGSNHTHLTLQQVQNLLHTQATQEFLGNRESVTSTDHHHAKAEQLWQGVLQDAWAMAHQHERRRLGERSDKNKGENNNYKWPFVVCDTHYQKTGDKCKTTIEQVTQSHDLLPLYNKVDMTCFSLQAQPSLLQKRLPSTGMTATPMVPEMKIAGGLLDNLGKIERFDVTFCPGQTKTDQDTMDLATRLYQDELLDAHGRHLRARSFLGSRVHRHAERYDFWQRQLGEPSSSATCQDLFASLTLESSFHTGMTLTISEAQPDLKECLSALVVDLAMHPEVCFVGGYQRIQLRNDIASGLVQSGDTQSRPLHDMGIDGRGQVVALSDTGIDTDNCYFFDPQGHVAPKSRSGKINFQARKVVQYVAFADGKENAKGHGTHVAGSLVGERFVDGEEPLVGKGTGVAPGGKLAFFDIGDAETMEMHVPDPWTLFGPGFKAGARIHSASWGVPLENSYTAYDSAIDMYMYQNPDFLFIVAAGNEGEGDTPHTVGSPAITKNSIAVGATRHTRNHESIAQFSSRGPTADGRLKPDVLAPGQSILSARADPGREGECDDSNGLVRMSGTSMATPMVAGAAALVRQYFMDGWHYDGTQKPAFGYSPRASLVKAVILNGAEELLGEESERESVAYDRNQGFGRVNLAASLPMKGKNGISGIFVNSKRISSQDHHIYEVTVQNPNECTAPLSATLVWTDPPVAPNCNRGCVLNNLDLYVTRAGSAYKIFPNGLKQSDSTNNAERVRIENPIVDATYTLHVVGTELLSDQDYSLVITGCMVPTEDLEEYADPEDDHTSQATDSASSCDEDGDNQVAVSDTEIQSCSWLSEHLDSYMYLCEFDDVATSCPSTCRNCPTLSSEDSSSHRSATVPLNGDVRWYGIHFDVEAKKSMVLHGFDLHLNTAGSHRVQLVVREGVQDLDDDATPWTTLWDSEIESKGLRKGTHVTLPESFGMRKSRFYTFSLTVAGNPALVMTRLDANSISAVLETEDILVRSGVAVSDKERASHSGFSFNGSLKYTLPQEPECSDNAGTAWIEDGVGAQSCEWLSKNMARFGYVCSFTDLAAFCPQTCGRCDQ